MTIKFRNNWLAPSLGALLMWGGWAFLPKLAMKSLSPQSVLFYEALGGMPIAIPVFFFLKGKLEKDVWGIAFTAGGSFFAILGILAYYYALRLGPVATVATVAAMYPVVTLALARIFLKEKINRLQLVAAGMALVAIGLLAG